MPDWLEFVERHLQHLRLARGVREEVCSELSHHMEDLHEQLLSSGMSEEAASREILQSITYWQELAHDIEREKGGDMSKFGREFLVPSGVALGIATLALAIEIRLGPRPMVWRFDHGEFVAYKIWPVILLLTGAFTAFLARRSGAAKARRVLVASTPALYMLGTMLFIAVVSIPLQLFMRGKLDSGIVGLAMLIGLVNWVALPGIALTLGALPFLRDASNHCAKDWV